MGKDIVIYKNRIEVKILSIVYFIIFVPILIILLVETVKRGINELWPFIIMFGCIFLFIGFWIFIIARYRVKFDFINENIIYTPYFKRTKNYRFNEVSIEFVRDKTILETYDIYFYVNNKKVFKISEPDFEFQTKCNSCCLRKLFKGEAKIIYDTEKYLMEYGASIRIFNYSFDKNIGVIYLTNKHISFGFDNKLKSFIIIVYEDYVNEQLKPVSKILYRNNKEINSSDLIYEILEVFQKYSKIYLLKAVATKLIDNSTYPEVVECEIVDAKGIKHIFHEKWPVVSAEDYDDVYPKICDIACIIEASLIDTVIVNTNTPWGCESIEGDYRFEVFKKDLIEYTKIK